jgi:hypothetical protein
MFGDESMREESVYESCVGFFSFQLIEVYFFIVLCVDPIKVERVGCIVDHGDFDFTARITGYKVVQGVMTLFIGIGIKVFLGHGMWYEVSIDSSIETDERTVCQC